MVQTWLCSHPSFDRSSLTRLVSRCVDLSQEKESLTSPATASAANLRGQGFSPDDRLLSRFVTASLADKRILGHTVLLVERLQP
jgi:hypothetical protein